ncbi:MAG: S1/P1 nuclease [Chthoniobacterales bacterium]|nr:S1/P1 nuclease [Chthoniobacterales bacterium]
MTFRILLFVGVLVSSMRPALAWDSVGHMIVAQIAWDQLTPEAKAGVEEALGRFNEKKASDRTAEDAPYDFVTAACWMDDIRSMQDRYDFGPWHYVNFPFNLEGLPEPEAAEGPNVIWGIQRCMDLMTGRAEDQGIDRDQAMVMLLHLVGDIHQPLHTTNRGGDLGGNLVTVRNMKLSREEEMFGKKRGGSLHGFWDSSYRRGFREGGAMVLYEMPIYDGRKPAAGHLAAMEIVRREASALQEKHPGLGASLLDDPAAWAHESHAIGYEKGYGKLIRISPTGTLVKVDEHYVNTAREAAEQRLVLAGNRMAALINRHFAPPGAAAADNGAMKE